MDQATPTSETFFTKIAQHIADSAGVPIDKIIPESKFNDLGMDSLDALALIGDLEDEYKIKIPNQEVLKIKTIGQAVEAMERAIK